MDAVPYGKRIKSSVDEILRVRFPESDKIITLPAGRPSPPVDSFIRGEFYQLGPVDGQYVYLKKSDNQTIVDNDHPDESGIYNAAVSRLSDAIYNSLNSAGKYAGFLSDGFKESVSGVSAEFSLFGGQLKRVLLVAIPAAILIFTLYAISKFR